MTDLYEIDVADDGQKDLTGTSGAWNEDEDKLSRKPLTIVVSFDAIIDQDGVIEDIAHAIRTYHEKNYYILIDSHIGLLDARDILEDAEIPFDGLTFDKDYGKHGDLERYVARVDSHIVWKNVTATMNTSQERFEESLVMGKESMIVECGVIAEIKKRRNLQAV